MGVEFDENTTHGVISQRMEANIATHTAQGSFFERLIGKMFGVTGQKAQYILLAFALLFFIASGVVAYLFLRPANPGVQTEIPAAEIPGAIPQ